MALAAINHLGVDFLCFTAIYHGGTITLVKCYRITEHKPGQPYQSMTSIVVYLTLPLAKVLNAV